MGLGMPGLGKPYRKKAPENPAGPENRILQEVLNRPITRRQAISKTAVAVGIGVAGLVVGGVGGYFAGGAGAGQKTATVTSTTSRSVAPGATVKERALNGVAALKASGKVKDGDTVTIMHFAGTAGTFTSSQAEWERSTGTKLKLVEVPIESSFDKVILESTAKTGTFDLFVVNFVNMGDFASSKVILPLEDWVQTYNPNLSGQPDGYMYPTGLQTMTNDPKHVWALDIDTDTYTMYYRKSLMTNPTEQANFEKQFGYPLAIPQTWDQYRDVVSFFHRPSQGLFGTYEFRQLFWGYRQIIPRYACKKYPSMYYFDDQMHPLINGPEGYKAAQQYVETVKFADPEILSIAWTENYGRFAAGKGFASMMFPSLAKFCNIPSLSKIVGDLIYAMPPGDYVDSPIGQKVLLHRNNHDGSWSCYVSAYSHNPELAYLYAQFLTSPEIIPIASSAVGSFADPARYSQVLDSRQVGPFPYDYLHNQPYDYVSRTSVCIPGLTLPGGNEYITNLDKNLQAAASGAVSPADAMDATAKQWEATTDRIGRSQQITYWQYLKSLYPLTAF